MELQGKEAHDFIRRQAGRQCYIAWRMNDVPAVYQNLMPFTYMAKELWMAEKAIREQISHDQELLASPWRRLGPQCNIIAYDGMSSQQLLDFAIEVEIPVGMEDQPKVGSVFARQLEAARTTKKESTPQRQRVIDLRNAALEARLSPEEFSDLCGRLHEFEPTASAAQVVDQFLKIITAEKAEKDRDAGNPPLKHGDPRRQAAEDEDETE